MVYCRKSLYHLLNTTKYYCAIAFLLPRALSLTRLHNYFPFHLSFINRSVTYIYIRRTLYTIYTNIMLLVLVLVHFAIIYWFVEMHSGDYWATEHISNCRTLLQLQRFASLLNDFEPNKQSVFDHCENKTTAWQRGRKRDRNKCKKY